MDTITKIKAKMQANRRLYSRMDTDRKIAYLNKFVMTDTKGKKVSGVANVTMNDPAVYANAIASTLMTSKWQTQVTSKVKQFKTYLIEQFVNDAEYDADERLGARGEPSLFETNCNRVCLRSIIGCRFLWREDPDMGVYPEFRPVDMRWTPYQYSTRGLAWVAETCWMSDEEIAADFPEANLKTTGQDIEVIDYWDEQYNEVYIGGALLWKHPHLLGYPPFVIAKPATGFMLRDKGYLEYEAESIFHLNRDLYDEWNRIVSIEQTLNLKTIMPAYQKESADMSGEAADYPDKVGRVVEVLPGEKYSLLETQDVNNAHRLANNVVSNALQRGGVNNIDLGNVTQQTSAVWITEQAEIRTKILEPRLKCLAAFKQQIARMMIDQYIQGGYKTEIGKDGAKNLYDFKDLGDPKSYRIEFALRSKSKKMEIANLAMAQGARGILSEESIITNILEVDDPEGELEKLDYEKAEAADPALFLMRKAFSLAERAELREGLEADRLKLESMRLTRKGCDLIRAERMMAQQGQISPTAGRATPKPNSNTLIPMMSQNGGMGASLQGIQGNPQEVADNG